LTTIILCEDTGLQPEDGVCPFHGGDACMFGYYHIRTVYPHGSPIDWVTIPKSEYEGLQEVAERYENVMDTMNVDYEDMFPEDGTDMI
jgi:hypothetical protein